MSISVKPVSEQPLRNKNYLKTKLERSAGEYKERVAKWNKDTGGKPDGYSFKRNSHKSWSRVLVPSEEFRRGYDAIDWKA